ncbi:hypothetical protein D3C84_1061650 [compost metagenome]
MPRQVSGNSTINVRGDHVSGRNNKPDNDGPAGKPGRLDQYGDKLGSSNEEEFEAAANQACDQEQTHE